jgi:hypothetical protein
MRHLLVDHARKRNAAKRGDGKAALTLEDRKLATDDDTVAVGASRSRGRVLANRALPSI